MPAWDGSGGGEGGRGGGRAGGPAGRSRGGAEGGGFPRRADPLELAAYLAILATGQHADTTVKIRLTRGGAKKRPFYHIVVTVPRSPLAGRNSERVGCYDPVRADHLQRVGLATARVRRA